jgi:hypothetical protein
MKRLAFLAMSSHTTLPAHPSVRPPGQPPMRLHSPIRAPVGPSRHGHAVSGDGRNVTAGPNVPLCRGLAAWASGDGFSGRGGWCAGVERGGWCMSKGGSPLPRSVAPEDGQTGFRHELDVALSSWPASRFRLDPEKGAGTFSPH